MTQTLRRERIQKFRELCEKYNVTFYPHPNTIKESDEKMESFVQALADASISRSERTDDLTDAEREQIAREYNAPVFRGDYRDYPEHLHEVARVLRDVWMFKLPEKPRKGSKKSEYAFWIMAMEQIRESCLEFGIQTLEKAHEKWRAGFKDGLAPFTVATPQSIVKWVASVALEMRQAQSKERANHADEKGLPLT